MKYVQYNNRGGCGFGNQMRSFAGAFTLAKFTNRKLIVTDEYINKAFNSPYKISKEDLLINCSNKNQKKFTPSPVPQEKNMMLEALNNDLNFQENIINCGDGYDMGGNYLIKNPHYKKKYNDLLESISGNRYYDYLTHYWSPAIGSPTDEFASIAKKNIDYDHNEYVSVQFRAFYDADNKFLHYLDNFLNKMLEVFKDRGIREGKVFVTSDTQDVTDQITSNLTNFDVIKSSYPIIHSQDFKLESIADWLTIAKSKFIFSTGTSYATTAAIYANKPMYMLGQYNGYINKVWTQF